MKGLDEGAFDEGAFDEGIIKFDLDHKNARLTGPDVVGLIHWREILKPLGLIGRDPDRYAGYGFGNLSRRSNSGFIITGSQTGAKDVMNADDFAEVTDYQLQRNRVSSKGLVPPSSESLTHAAVYDSNSSISCVFHVHSPEIWQAMGLLHLRATPADVAYGTLAMANAVSDLISGSEGIFCMAGHADGVVSYGTDLMMAGLLLIEVLLQSKMVNHKDPGDINT